MLPCAVDLFRRLDELAGGSVFGQLYAEQVQSDAFPDLADLYRRLGLNIAADGTLTIQDGAPRSADRDAIMTGLAGGPEGRSISK